MKKPILAAMSALVLSACVTATPFQPASKHTSAEGYSDQQLQNDRWRVTFSGNEVTSRQTVESYMLFRAAELTLQNGFDWFETTDRTTQAYVDWDWGPSYGDGYYGDGWWGPWGGYWSPRWTYDDNWGAGTAYQVQTDILMHHGERPKDNLRAFDARQVIAHVGPKVIRPKPEA